jgi:hypothetical protein
MGTDEALDGWIDYVEPQGRNFTVGARKWRMNSKVIYASLTEAL